MDNHGCLKCHCVFTYHVSKDCPNDWPNAAAYHPVTVANITTAKKAGRVRKTTTVAVMPADNSTSSSVAAV